MAVVEDSKSMETSFGKQLGAIMAIDPAAPAIEQNGRWFSWGELAAVVDAVNAALDEAGLDSRHRVGVFIRNRTSPLAGMLALFTAGRPLVVLNPMLAREKLLQDLRELKLSAVVGEKQDVHAPDIAAVLAEAGCAIVALDPDLGGATLEARPSQAMIDAGSEAHAGTAVEMLTSGTTGPPKRIPLSRKDFDVALRGALVFEKQRNADDLRLRSGVSLHSAPLAHIGGVFGMLNTLLGGRKLALFEKFSVAAWRDAVVRHRPKVASLPPAALRMVLDAHLPKEDLASLTALRSGTAPLPPATAFEFLDRYGLPVLQAYGATEFIGGIAGWTIEDFRAHFQEKSASCGRIYDGIGARIVDPATGDELARGTEGVLELKTPQIRGGREWYRTTDRASIDEDGFLTICGRTDSAIIRGGFKVHPDEVVRALEKHPAVREASVVPLADARLGEVPAAAVILWEGKSVTAEELGAFARDSLSAYQVPARFLFVNDLPRTPSMKPALPEVRALIEQSATD